MFAIIPQTNAQSSRCLLSKNKLDTAQCTQLTFVVDLLL